MKPSAKTLPARRSPEGSALRPGALATWISVVRAYNLCDAVLAQRLAALNLRVVEHEVLINLLRSPGLTQQALARACFVAKGAFSMLLTRMEDAGLVQREADAADARVKRLVLTRRGEALAKKAEAVQREVVAAMVDGASDEELRQVREAMDRVSGVLEAMLV